MSGRRCSPSTSGRTASWTSGSSWSISRRLRAKSGARADYIRAEMQKLGLSDIRTDDMLQRQRRAKGDRRRPDGGVRSAHGHRVPQGTDLKVKRDGDVLRAPGIGDDTSNLMAVARDVPRARPRWRPWTRGDFIFLASTQEEVGLLGAKHWLETSARKPEMFVAVDIPSSEVRYGALRITQFKFFYTSPGAHTLESRGGPSNRQGPLLRRSRRFTRFRFRRSSRGLGTFSSLVLNVGMLEGGTVENAVPRETWFTVDLRSLDTPTQERLEGAVVEAAQRAAQQAGVGFRMAKNNAIDYSKARAARGAAQSSARADRAGDPQPFQENRARPPSFPPTSD